MTIHRIPVSFQNRPYQVTTWDYPDIKRDDSLVLFDSNDGHEVDAEITDIILGTYVHFRPDFKSLRPIEGWEPKTVGAGAPLMDRIEEILEEEYGSQGGMYSQVAEKIVALLQQDSKRVVFDTVERQAIHPYEFLERSNSFSHRDQSEFEFREVDTFRYVQNVKNPAWLFDDWDGIMEQGRGY